MGMFKGGALRLAQTGLYALLFLTTAVILGVYSYFLSVLADRDVLILNQWKAVTGIAGAAVLYTIFAVILTCCLGGIAAFALIAVVLDVLFVGGMIAVAILTRDGADSCSGLVQTPIGSGIAGTEGGGFDNIPGDNTINNITYAVSPRTACRLNTAAFACSIIAALLFVVTALVQVLLSRHHKKEKRYGPSPSNNYTSGSGPGKFWQRKSKDTGAFQTRDTEMAAGGLSAPGHDMRPSHETAYTGTTVNGTGTGTTYDKVDHPTGVHSGYYTQPQGTGVNPYGYERTTGTATNY